jgi:hypothetical protein
VENLRLGISRHFLKEVIMTEQKKPKEIIHVTTDDRGVAEATSSSDRPRTNIGPQGDHTSAFALIKFAILFSIENLNIDAACENLFAFLLNVKKREVPENLITQIRKEISIFSDEKNRPEAFVYVEEQKSIEEALEKSGLDDSLVRRSMIAIQRSNFHYFEKLASFIANKLLECRSKQRYVAFPGDGNISPPKGEGARVKTAIKKLSISKEQKELNVKKIAQCMFELFWYPKIPKEKLLDPESITWKTICEESGFKKGTLPRSNDPKILHEVTANHLDLIFICFPHLYDDYGKRKEIIDEFLELIASKGKIAGKEVHWSMSQQETRTFKSNVCGEMPEYLRESSMLSDQTDAQMMAHDPESKLLAQKILRKESLSDNGADSDYQPSSSSSSEDEAASAPNLSPIKTRQKSNRKLKDN